MFSQQNDTMRVMYVYNQVDPRVGFVGDDLEVTKGLIALQLLQRHVDVGHRSESVRALELRNSNVPVSMVSKSMKWCRFFEMSDFDQKHHMIRVSCVILMVNNTI